ncbi:tRNA (cytosine(38)-C(5))-methyltransferase isoform X2 [Nothobranchius furzeri]|uniref:tRNA (cytosine(38)-C(5))-methyltransferase n=1 Tax=Nothobranchius furzeri TaxID=105023 RepID=A0A9D2Y3X7_NOTFU|nr:tRNA (cytosine(38)-C(5))-methyltransferase isoform X2 [Nothobranchius furzeri]KAF7213582.1 transcript variant X2 [Nothobranchius furzeri]
MEVLRVLELYSGIGGMHYALKESGIPAQVVAAIDINTTANQIYKHNFPDTPIWNKTIEGITLEDFNKLSFDMIMMSPPCQPFTRLGLQGDISDPRTKSFLYILDLLPRECLVKTLMECGYDFQEFMLSPSSVGIPNSRLRYFLIGKISTEELSIQTSSMVPCTPPPFADSSVLTCTFPHPGQPAKEEHSSHVLYKRETPSDVQRKTNQNNDLSIKQIRDFLEPLVEENMERFLLSPKTLSRYGLLLDIVQPKSRRSVCFTKGYGRYVEGTGSVLQCCMETEMESVFTGLDQLSEQDKVDQLLKLKLRYFTPREVANLMGFPADFSFPQDVSVPQQYRVLGNSLNVVVVTRLLQLLLSEHFGHSAGEQLFASEGSVGSSLLSSRC